MVGTGKGNDMANGNKIVRGLHEAVSFAQGDTKSARLTKVNVPDNIDVRALRERLGLSQAEFAFRFGFSLGTLRHWEQGRRYPDGSARLFLAVIDQAPEAVEQAIQSIQQKRAVG
jgi:putative transcriptional regulator